MRKLIICGGDRSGKTFLAKNIAAAFDHVVWLDGRMSIHAENSFKYDGVTKETDLIIVDDVKHEQLHIIQDLIFSDKIEVNSKGKKRFTMNTPNVIIALSVDASYFNENALFSDYTVFCKIINTWVDKGDNGIVIRFFNKEVKVW